MSGNKWMNRNVHIRSGESSGRITTFTAQSMTTSWVNFGAQLSLSGYNNIGIFLNIDITSTGGTPSLRLLGGYSSATALYALPLVTPSTVTAIVNPLQWDIKPLATDQKLVVGVDVLNSVKYGQFQIKADTSASGHVNAFITRGWM